MRRFEGQRQRKFEKIEETEKQLRNNNSQYSPEETRQRAQRREAEDALRDTRAALVRREAERRLAEYQTTNQWQRDFARNDALRFDVGETPAEQMLSRQLQLTNAIQAAMQRVWENTSTGEQRQQDLNSALEYNLELERNIFDMHRRRAELDRDAANLEIRLRRERERGALGAGPEELLRRLAAHNVAQRYPRGGMSAGDWFALDSNTRAGLMRDYSQFNPEMAQNRRDAAALDRNMPDDPLATLRGLSDRQAEILAQFQAGLSENLTYLNLGAEAMARLEENANNAARALARLPAEVNALARDAVSRASGGPARNAGNPH